ncbi:MAG TPA: peptidoglycan-binding protein, partial [Feifaniaceae bacterium]|nr:peptidoglycan-binding protein [Feifaniaceae bacterium]
APSPTPEPTPAPATVSLSAYETLQEETESEAVSVLQARLMELGYFDYDEITTYFGTATKSAVMLFQRTAGLEETGVADSHTQEMLFSVNAQPYRMKLGDKGSDVRGMQRRLNELGYYEGKDNGYFGIATERAVKSFQARNKIEQSGTVDQDARNLLYSPNARYLVDPTPTPTPKPTPKATPKPTAKPTEKPTAIPSDDWEIPILDPGDSEPSYEEATPTPTKTSKPTEQPSSPGSYDTSVEGYIAAAMDQLGKPYVWSEEGPDSFDCSGLVYYSLRLAGISTGRYNAVGFSQVSNWEAVTSLSKCRRGDLLFYKSDTNSEVNHAGIYLGNGQFIHASSSKGKVMISTTTDYYERNFVIARRIF